MDPSVLIQPLLNLWYFIPLVLLLTILRSFWFKGQLRDVGVNVSAHLFLERRQSAVMQRRSQCFVIAITKMSNDYRRRKVWIL